MVIANPPYVSIQGLTITERELYKRIFKFFYHRYDLFGCFIEKGIELLNADGLLCYIQPSVFLNSKSFMKIRKFLVEATTLLNLNLLKDGVFESAVVPTMIMCLRNSYMLNNEIVCSQGKIENFYSIKQSTFEKTEANVFNLDLKSDVADFIAKITKNTVPLGEIARVSNAINTGNLNKYLETHSTDNNIKVLKGASINKWIYKYDNLFLSAKFNEFVSCGDIEVLQKPKLMMKRIGIYPNVCYDDTGIASFHTVHTIRITSNDFSPLFIMALMNSKLIGKVFRMRVPLKGNVFPEFRVFDLNKQIPIKSTTSEGQLPIINLVNQILEAKQDNPQADTSALEAQIDQLVYELYGLTQEEIDIIEGN